MIFGGDDMPIRKDRNGHNEFTVEGPEDLIKREGGFYVPWDYDYYSDTGRRKGEYQEDVNESFPTVTFDNVTSKFKATFIGAGFDGYDTQVFTYYFDSLNQLLRKMFKGIEFILHHKVYNEPNRRKDET